MPDSAFGSPRAPRPGRLYLTIGLPGAGKTTRAKAWVAEDPEHRIRVNRDDLRVMTHGRRVGEPWHEDAISIIQRLSVAGLLGAGWDVVCDDTNLHPGSRAMLSGVARAVGAQVEIWDMTDVPMSEVLLRNNRRAGTPAFVPPDVILRMWERYVASTTPAKEAEPA